METNKNNSRRNFVKKTSLGLGAVGIGLSLNSVMAGNLKFNSDKKLGVALVGLGNYATNQLAPALQETDHCYLAGIVTGTKTKEKIWADKYNIPEKNIYNYENYDTIISNKDIDIIYVVLPNAMHAEFTIRAAKAGKHVICEKPMALSVSEGNAMVKACEENNVKLSIGYRLQFDPYHKTIINLSKEKNHGKITYVNSQFGFSIGDPTQWRLNKKLAGGGALMDVGVYCIQAARYSFGQEPIALSAQEFNSGADKFKEVDETITWQMEFPDGKISNSTTSYGFNVNSLLVSTEKTRVTLMPAYSYRGLKGTLGNEVLEFPPVNQQALQMDAFAMNVKENTKSFVSGEEGVRDLKVVEAIYKSIALGGKRVII